MTPEAVQAAQLQVAQAQANAAWISAGVTGVLVLITFFYAWTSHRQVGEMVKTRLAEFEPFVTIRSAVPATGEENFLHGSFTGPPPGMLLKMTNLWTGPALGVGADMSHPSGLVSRVDTRIDLGGISTSDIVDMNFVRYPNVANEMEDLPLEAHLQLRYEDILRRKWISTIPLRLHFKRYSFTPTPYCTRIEILGPAGRSQDMAPGDGW